MGSRTRRPDYRLVAIFYAMAFGWVSFVALALHLAGASRLSYGAALVAQLTVGFLYMPPRSSRRSSSSGWRGVAT